MSGEPAGIVLVVDDDPDMRDLLRRALTDAGLTAVLADSGAAALRLLDELVPDIILLDAIMPPPDGFATCRLIKQRVGLATVPVVFMTGLDTTEHVIAGLQAGGVDYLTKPPLLVELVARLRVHIATGWMTRSAQRALDTAGRKLISTDRHGTLRWSTPQAAALLVELGIADDDPAFTTLLRSLLGDGAAPITIFSCQARRLQVSVIAPSGDDHFFRIKELIDGQDVAILRHNLALTPREADVLYWIAAGKTNRDASEILNISVRTVDKHLEQIFVKLGVENRAAATAMALRAIAATS